VWEELSIQQRVDLCNNVGIEGKYASRSYSNLASSIGNIPGLGDEQLMELCNRYCPACDTDWPLLDLIAATTTPQMLEVFERNEAHQ
jgi:hypothetical protein